MNFDALGLSKPLLQSITEIGFVAPTAVQSEVIPAVLAKQDVWASAKTGSGKTAAFVLPLIERLVATPAKTPRKVRALILAPTRELAAQIADAIEDYGCHLGARALKTSLVVGGISINPQMMDLRGGADIVVATPGRLLDLEEKNALDLADLELLVLDEADRLLSLGFAEEVARIVLLLPSSCQRLLFSATFPPAVKKLAAALLKKPVRIEIDGGMELAALQATITQRAIEVDTGKRTMLLRHLLDAHGWRRVLVFVATRYTADLVADKLRRAHISAASFHGDLSQTARLEALAALKSGRVRVLIATDLSARGIDIAALPAVVNYDLPRSPVDYVHRIGRTGRAGEPGMAVSFITADSDAHFSLIEKRHHSTIDRETIPGFERTEVAAPRLDPHGGVKGRRKSKKDKLREAAAKGVRKDDL